MLKQVLASSVFMLAPTEGVWVTKEGEQVIKPCETDFVNQRMRMMRGCISPQAGVLLTRDYFVSLETDKVERDKLLEGKDEMIEVLEGRVKALEAQLKLLAVRQEPEMGMPSYISMPIGVGIGFIGCSLISMAGAK